MEVTIKASFTVNPIDANHQESNTQSAMARRDKEVTPLFCKISVEQLHAFKFYTFQIVYICQMTIYSKKETTISTSGGEGHGRLQQDPPIAPGVICNLSHDTRLDQQWMDCESTDKPTFKKQTI